MDSIKSNSVTLVLTPQQLVVISEALSLAPYGKVAPVVMDINYQIQHQASLSAKVSE